MRMLVLGGGLQGFRCAWARWRTSDAEVTPGERGIQVHEVSA